jgi:molybdenum cofactor cytidylyltransferase
MALESGGSGQGIGAVVLAAGQSRRMGSSKMVLPWGKTTVIAQVVGVLLQCPIEAIVVVTGGAADEVQAALQGLPVTLVHNPNFNHSEMIDSLRIGLRAMSTSIQTALVALGDQPQIRAEVVAQLAARRTQAQTTLLVPSYHMRRGHPWLVDRCHWAELYDLPPAETLRGFLSAHAREIDYVLVDTPSVLSDLDTPEAYQRSRPDSSTGGE